jgi:peptidoglycan-N-acetylglucosamine deacetylase
MGWRRFDRVEDASPIHLTFDDGPDPVWTPCILDRLAAAGAQATFFVLGTRVRRHPELVDEIRAGGHAVGLHGDAHLDHAAHRPELIARDTEAALAALRAAGACPRLWRLPWGRLGPATEQLARAHALRLVPWDHDTHDWRGDAWRDQPAEVRAGVAAGGIVLLHDAVGPGATRTGCANTLELLDHITALAAERGAALVPLPEPAHV